MGEYLIAKEELIYRVQNMSPQMRKLANEAVERQKRMTPEDKKKAIEQLVSDVMYAND